jgi:hypothetical protein
VAAESVAGEEEDLDAAATTAMSTEATEAVEAVEAVEEGAPAIQHLWDFQCALTVCIPTHAYTRFAP